MEVPLRELMLQQLKKSDSDSGNNPEVYDSLSFLIIFVLLDLTVR